MIEKVNHIFQRNPFLNVFGVPNLTSKKKFLHKLFLPPRKCINKKIYIHIRLNPLLAYIYIYIHTRHCTKHLCIFIIVSSYVCDWVRIEKGIPAPPST